jgi:hypothetical protein
LAERAQIFWLLDFALIFACWLRSNSNAHHPTHTPIIGARTALGKLFQELHFDPQNSAGDLYNFSILQFCQRTPVNL